MNQKARAKINLMLRVVGKYSNGYHELQMLNARINLWDDIEIHPTTDHIIKVEINNLVVDDKDNIVLKAVLDLVRMFRVIEGVTIIINKKIPAGSGLGGASADLACIVQALNQIYDLKIKDEEMIAFVKQYSADAPYCLYNDLALVEGIGEKVEPLPLNVTDYIMVVTPPQRNQTKEIFKKVYKYTSKINKCDIINEDMEKLMVNDLQEVAMSMNEQIKLIIDDLSKITKKVVMTGSGSSVIALFDYTMSKKICDYIANNQTYSIYLSTIYKELS